MTQDVQARVRAPSGVGGIELCSLSVWIILTSNILPARSGHLSSNIQHNSEAVLCPAAPTAPEVQPKSRAFPFVKD